MRVKRGPGWDGCEINICNLGVAATYAVDGDATEKLQRGPTGMEETLDSEALNDEMQKGKSGMRTVWQYDTLPLGWRSLGRAPAQRLLTVRLALRQSAAGLEALEARLMEISDPLRKDHYGKWLSKAEVERLVAPPEASFDVIERWLRVSHDNNGDGGVAPARIAGDAIQLEASVKKLERLFGVELHLICRGDSDAASRRRGAAAEGDCDKPLVRAARGRLHLPAVVADVIELVSPLFSFPQHASTQHDRRSSLTGMPS